MFFKYFSRQISFSRTFQDSPVYSSTYQACANPVLLKGSKSEKKISKPKIIATFLVNKNAIYWEIMRMAKIPFRVQ